MKRLLVITFALFTLTSCGNDNSTQSGGSSSSESQTGNKPKANVIVAAGDSISTGYNAGVAFPSVVQSRTGIKVLNYSTIGIPAEQIAHNAVNAIVKHNPKYVISMMGTNNALGHPGGVPGAINAAQYLAQVCREVGTTLILGTLPPITLGPQQNANSAAISNAVKGISGVRIADARAVVGRDDLPDGLHPNSAAQTRIGEVFAAQIY